MQGRGRPQWALAGHERTLEILKAIGWGIGNNAAHEIGHQLNLPQMHSPPSGYYENGNAKDPAVYLNPKLQWTDDSHAVLQRILAPL